MEERCKKKKYVEKHPPDKKPKYVQKNQETNEEKRPQPRQPKQKETQVPHKYISKKSSQPNEQFCSICTEPIKKRDYIWTCHQQCYKSLHLACIKKWILNVNQDKKGKGHYIYNWFCPECKSEYNENMPQYFCYCGKFKNPEFQRDLQPHSCGQVCGRKRGIYCTHPCPLLCHKGKCPPCEHEGSVISCNCGKAKRVIKCSEDKQVFQCGQKCKKILNCHKHYCEKNCHNGPCLPCNKKRLVKCHCGKNQDVVDCTEVTFNCHQQCGKILDCGVHKCQQQCHQGECTSCKRNPKIQKTCNCGKYSLMMLTGDEDCRKSCQDPIPSCGMPCKKLFQCGHVCPRNCHQGKCPPCKVVVEQACNCGQTNRKVQCNIAKNYKHQFKCQNICKRKKQCGVHTCNEPCCKNRNSIFPDSHPCDITCNKILNCGKHTCDQPCHLGACKKCAVVYSQPQPCPCGATSLKPPIICGTLTPECENHCKKQMDCSHNCGKFCHYGQCKCYQRVLVKCRCRKQLIETDCGKETLCLNYCDKTLDCGHKCSLQCHAESCKQAHKKIPCKKQCTKKRQCGHFCTYPCHYDRPCQEFPCEAQILIKCACGNRQTTIICGSAQKKTHKTIKCNEKCENVKRFDSLYKNKSVYYPNAMFQFGMKHLSYLQSVQTKLVKFISQSQAPMVQIQFKFINDMNAKLQMHTLFENHYHLNTHFYRYRNHASFTLMQTQDTMIPKPSLSEYIKLVSQGKIKRNNLPFEYTIKFESPYNKDKIELILKSIKTTFKHKYYLQRKDKMVIIHFWQAKDGIYAKAILEEENLTIEFIGEENLLQVEQVEKINQQEIIEQENIPQQETQEKNSQLKSEQHKQIPQMKTQNTEERLIEGENTEEKKEVSKLEGMKEITANKESKITHKKKPTLVVHRQTSPFLKPLYPPAKDYVQDIYEIDEDQLYGQKVNFSTLVNKLCDKKIGPQAAQWRIRALLMISSIHDIPDKIFSEQFSKLITMYEKDKKRAERILELQKIETRQVKSELEKDGIYISKNQPEIYAYMELLNEVLAEKIEQLPLQLPQILLNTPEVTKALQTIHSVHNCEYDIFYEEFRTADFLLACAMKGLIKEIRQNFLEKLIKNSQKIKSANLWKYLLFESEQQFLRYCKKKGAGKITKRMSNSLGYEIYYLNTAAQTEVELEELTDEEQLKQINALIKQKRNKKYFLTQPQQLIDDTYMTRSFFAFGDFKQVGSDKYLLSLAKKLKND